MPCIQFCFVEIFSLTYYFNFADFVLYLLFKKTILNLELKLLKLFKIPINLKKKKKLNSQLYAIKSVNINLKKIVRIKKSNKF